MELTTDLSQKVANYQPSQARLNGVHDVPLLFIVGTSGAGKDTLMQRLLVEHSNQYHPFITHTTRKPRMNNGVMERNDIDYHFVDFAAVNDMLDRQDFIEANVFSGNIYGTSLAEMEEARQEAKIVVSNIDVNGVLDFIRLGLNVKPVFVLPPSYDVWQQRLLKRYDGHVDTEDWQRRMESALYEVQHVINDGNFYLVINDDLNQTVKAIDDIAHSKDKQPSRPASAQRVAQEILEQIQLVLNK